MGSQLAGTRLRPIQVALLQPPLNTHHTPKPRMQPPCPPHLQLLQAHPVPDGYRVAAEGGEGVHRLAGLLGLGAVSHLQAPPRQRRTSRQLSCRDSAADGAPLARGHRLTHVWPARLSMGTTQCAGAGPEAHSGQAVAGQVQHRIHRAAAAVPAPRAVVAQVQAQHIRQQRAPPLPHRAAKILRGKGTRAQRAGWGAAGESGWRCLPLDPRRMRCSNWVPARLPHLAAAVHHHLLQHRLSRTADALAAHRGDGGRQWAPRRCQLRTSRKKRQLPHMRQHPPSMHVPGRLRGTACRYRRAVCVAGTRGLTSSAA